MSVEDLQKELDESRRVWGDIPDDADDSNAEKFGDDAAYITVTEPADKTKKREPRK